MVRSARAARWDAAGAPQQRPGWRLVGFLAFMALVLMACKGIEGVASLASATGRGQATVHFEAVCDGGTVTGELKYHDAPAKVNLRGVAQQQVGTCPTQWTDGPTELTVLGAYTPQPPARGPGGTVELRLTDTGPRGISGHDRFSLTLHGGVYDGYHNEGEWLRANWKLIEK